MLLAATFIETLADFSMKLWSSSEMKGCKLGVLCRKWALSASYWPLCGTSSAYLLSVIQSPLVRKRRLIVISLAELSGTPNPFPVSISDIDTHRRRQNIRLFHRGSSSIFPQGAQKLPHLSRLSTFLPRQTGNTSIYIPSPLETYCDTSDFVEIPCLGFQSVSFFCFLSFQVSEAHLESPAGSHVGSDCSTNRSGSACA